LLGAGAQIGRYVAARVSIDHENPQAGRRTWVDNDRQQRTETTVPKDLSSTKNRKKFSKKSFALPGKRKYPIPDKSHARNALARVAQHGTPEEKKKVRKAVVKRFPSLGKKRKKS
jgi:hypothetical protein